MLPVYNGIGIFIIASHQSIYSVHFYGATINILIDQNIGCIIAVCNHLSIFFTNFNIFLNKIRMMVPQAVKNSRVKKISIWWPS